MLSSFVPFLFFSTEHRTRLYGSSCLNEITTICISIRQGVILCNSHFNELHQPDVVAFNTLRLAKNSNHLQQLYYHSTVNLNPDTWFVSQCSPVYGLIPPDFQQTGENVHAIAAYTTLEVNFCPT